MRFAGHDQSNPQTWPLNYSLPSFPYIWNSIRKKESGLRIDWLIENLKQYNLNLNVLTTVLYIVYLSIPTSNNTLYVPIGIYLTR